MYVNKQLTIVNVEMSWAYATFMQTYWLDRCWSGVDNNTWVSDLSPARQRAYDRAQWYATATKMPFSPEQSRRYDAAYREWKRNGMTTAAALKIADTLQ